LAKIVANEKALLSRAAKRIYLVSDSDEDFRQAA
jgi:hypothetical protein